MSAFKIGDILTPIKGKKTSNDNKIETLIEIEVLTISEPSYGKRYMTTKIIKGFAKNYYGQIIKEGQNLTVYTDAFELLNAREPEYDPW